MKINEIELGGSVDSSILSDLEKEYNYGHDFKNNQLDLFPEIPTLELKLPKEFQILGRLNQYYVVQKNNNDDEYKEILLFDKAKPIAIVYLKKYSKRIWAFNKSVNAYQSKTILIDLEYRGQNLSLKFYHWLLTNFCDIIVADDIHTKSGSILWKKLNNSNNFKVYVYDDNRNVVRKRWNGKDLNQIYNFDHLIPIVVLPSFDIMKLLENESKSIPNEIYDFINELTPDDTGKEEIDNYIIRYEGFTDLCNEDVYKRMKLKPSNPLFLTSFDDVYLEIQEQWNKEENKKPLQTGFSGSDENPIQWAIYFG